MSVFVLVKDSGSNSAFFDHIETLLTSRFPDIPFRCVDYVPEVSKLASILQSCAEESDGTLILMMLFWYTDAEKKQSELLLQAMKMVQKKMERFSYHIIDTETVRNNIYYTLEEAFFKASLRDAVFTDTDSSSIQTMSFNFINSRITRFKEEPIARSMLVRMIHSTADFSLENDLVLSGDAIDSGLSALRNKAHIITDVRMVAAGIGTLFHDRVMCAVSEPDACAVAEEKTLTRCAAGMECLRDRLAGSIVVIGNAPTALVQCLRIVQRDDIQPALIIGCPVGFIGAAEAKEECIRASIPHVVLRGNRGGSNIAAAILNALGQWI